MSGETFQKLGSGVELGGYFGGGSIYSSHLLPITDGVAMLVTMEDGNSDQSVAKCRLIGVSAVGEITVGAATVIPTQWYDSNGGQTFAQWIMQPIHLGNNKVILPMEVNVIDGQPNGYMVEANPGALTVSYIGTLGAAVSVSANPRIVLTDYSGYGLMLDPDNNTLWWFDPDGTQHGMFSGNALTQQLGVEAMNGTYTHCGVTGKVAIIPDRGSIPAYNEMTVWDIDFVGRTVNSKTSVTIPGMDNRDTSNIAPGRTAGTVTLAAQTGIVTFSSRVRKDEFETVSITGSPTPSSDFSSAVEASSSPDNYFSFDAIAAADDGYVRIFNLYNSGNEAVVLAYHRPSSGFRKTITVETSGSRKYTDIVPVGNGLFLYQYEDDNYNVLHLGVCGVDINETSSWITGPLGPTTATPTYPGYEWPYEWGGVDAPVWLGATWKYCGITNPGGGTLNLKASDDTYTAPTYTPGSFDWGTPSAGAVDGPVTPVFDRWGDAAFNTIISPNAVSWGVGTTSTATHSVNISPGPSGFTDNNWADLPLGSDDWLVLGLLWRTTDYDRSGTIQVGNPTFDPATDGPAGWTYVGATPTADTTGWATPMPSLDGTRGAVWVVKYSDIAGTTDVNVTVNAYSTVFIKRIKVKSGWADPVVLLDVSLSGERTNASSTQIIPSDWAEGKNFGTRIAVVEIGYAGPYPSSSNDDNVGISTPYAGSSRSTSAWAWLAVEFATPVGSSPGLTLTEGALPDYTLNMDLVGQTGGVTSSTGTLDDWILYDPGPDYYVTMPDGSTVSLSPWGLERAPDGASGVGVFVCAASADTSAELTLELAAPGLSSSVTIPMSEFGTPPANPVLDPFLIPVETFYLPDAPAGWIDAYEAGTLSLTVTASGGPIYVWQVGMVSTYPTGSAFISDPIESEWDQAGTSGRTGWITDSLSVEMPAPPDLNHESIPNIFDESATPVRTSGVGFSTPNPTLARLNAAMGSPLGTYFETQKWSSVTITFGMEPKNLSIANEPQYRDGYPGYDLGAIGWYEEATEAARRHDINGWLSPAWYRWHQYYTSLAEHPEYEVSSTVTIRVPWTAHSDAPGGSNDYQWQIRFAPDAVVGDPQDPADKFDWDTYIPGGHDPSGQTIIGTAPVLLPEDTQSGVEVVNLLPGQFSMAGKDYTWVVQASQENVSRPYLDGPVSLFTSDEASTSLDYQHPTPGYSPGAWLDFKPGPYRVIFPSSWEGGGHSTDPYPGGGSGTDGGSSPGGTSPGRWHTADNYEPPPPGKPAGDGGVEDGWVHVSWMRRKDLGPGSGRTGRLKLRVKDANLPGGGLDQWPGGDFGQWYLPSAGLVDGTFAGGGGLLNPFLSAGTTGRWFNQVQLSDSRALLIWSADSGDPDYNDLIAFSLLDTSSANPVVVDTHNWEFDKFKYGFDDNWHQSAVRVSDTRAVLAHTDGDDDYRPVLNPYRGAWFVIDTAGDTINVSFYDDESWPQNSSNNRHRLGQMSANAAGQIARAVTTELDGASGYSHWVQVWEFIPAPTLVASLPISIAGSGYPHRVVWDRPNGFVYFYQDSTWNYARVHTVSGSTIAHNKSDTINSEDSTYMLYPWATSNQWGVLPAGVQAVGRDLSGHILVPMVRWSGGGTAMWAYDREAGPTSLDQVLGTADGSYNYPFDWNPIVAPDPTGAVAIADSDFGEGSGDIHSFLVWKDGTVIVPEQFPGPPMPASGFYQEHAITNCGPGRWLYTRFSVYQEPAVGDTRIIDLSGDAGGTGAPITGP